MPYRNGICEYCGDDIEGTECVDYDCPSHEHDDDTECPLCGNELDEAGCCLPCRYFTG